jgi:hypothetical protein
MLMCVGSCTTPKNAGGYHDRMGTWWHGWLRLCATSWKVECSIADRVIGIFHWHTPSGRTRALWLTEPLTEIGRAQLKCDGTQWCTGGEMKGKLANGMGSQYPSHHLGTWCIQHYYRRPARPRPTALLPPRSSGKSKGCYCICWTPDYGREDARNMLSCT